MSLSLCKLTCQESSVVLAVSRWLQCVESKDKWKLGFLGKLPHTKKVWTWFGFDSHICVKPHESLSFKTESGRTCYESWCFKEKLHVLVGSSLPHFRSALPGVTPHQTQCCSNTLPGQNLDPLLRECARLVSNGAGPPSWKVLQVWVFWKWKLDMCISQHSRIKTKSNEHGHNGIYQKQTIQNSKKIHLYDRLGHYKKKSSIPILPFTV